MRGCQRDGCTCYPKTARWHAQAQHSTSVFNIDAEHWHSTFTLNTAETLCPLAHQHNVAVLLNDRPDLARELGCDGVHIGQQDMPYKQARALLGPEAIIGVTCHASRHLAMLAGDAGADYVAFGAFFDTQTKDTTAQATPDILTWWQEVMEPPCVAIGGITPENGAELTMAGADFLAVSSGVWDHRDGPVAAMRAFDEIFARHR